MHALSEDLEETRHLCVLRDREVLTLLSSPGTRSGSTSGKAAASPQPAPQPTACSSWTRHRTSCTCASPGFAELPTLWAKFRRARADGFACVAEEFEPGSSCVSAPARDYRGRVVAALNISAPHTRIRDRLTTAGHRTVTAAASVSALLGWDTTPAPGRPV
ncbi:IclR family transcriptional regulator C-terminal domain-containing protein [Amycolatopsis sp. FDAARGOS 1241]|uniref:IclR family transcriptional regulator domain-containing protein n=1 Tax=Amycolatopsis sp. FDAARGOS 1241 TaxID=2778070 RepID=UPI001EF3B4FC|nr:IclR family transcriptional regulator C-terminal domain-containing protein [Amycolatopsis sp. FDAARGOS 1241]